MAEHFRIIAIRPLQPTLQDGRVIHMEKVQSIQKALFDKTDWLYFYRGITIDQEQGRISMTKEALADYSLYDLKDLKDQNQGDRNFDTEEGRGNYGFTVHG